MSAKLFIATTNSAKFSEIKYFLRELPLKFLSPQDLGIKEEPIEHGKTYKENAIIKAEFYLKQANLPVIADDGGIEIDFLHQQPGVQSKRWIDKSRTPSDLELIKYTLQKMKGVPFSQRGAVLKTVIAFGLPNGLIITRSSKIRGFIAEKPDVCLTKGYPYRALFYLPKIDKYYNKNSLSSAEYRKYCQRGKAIVKLIAFIKKYIIC